MSDLDWSPLTPALVASLRQMANQTAEWLVREHPSKHALEFFQWGLAINVLKQLIGEEWCERQVLTDKADGLLSHFGRSDKRAQVTQSRLVTFGEMLFNLQIAGGFPARLNDLRSADLHSGVRELEAAKLIIRYGSNLRFRVRQGTPGSQDYEADILLQSGRVLHCEVKAKQDTTQMSVDTLVKSARVARRQLPKAPSALFIFLPDRWVDSAEGLDAVLEEARDRILRSSKRLTNLIYVWDVWDGGPAQQLRRRTLFKEYLGSGSSARNLLAGAPDPSRWVDFREVCRDALSRMRGPTTAPPFIGAGESFQSRSAPCSCGSGRRFKHCHGSLRQE